MSQETSKASDALYELRLPLSDIASLYSRLYRQVREYVGKSGKDDRYALPTAQRIRKAMDLMLRLQSFVPGHDLNDCSHVSGEIMLKASELVESFAPGYDYQRQHDKLRKVS